MCAVICFSLSTSLGMAIIKGLGAIVDRVDHQVGDGKHQQHHDERSQPARNAITLHQLDSRVQDRGNQDGADQGDDHRTGVVDAAKENGNGDDSERWPKRMPRKEVSEWVSDMQCALERDSSLPRRELPEKSYTAAMIRVLPLAGRATSTHSIMARFQFPRPE